MTIKEAPEKTGLSIDNLRYYLCDPITQEMINQCKAGESK